MGAPSAGRGGAPGSRVDIAWWISGGLALVALVFIGLSVVRGGDDVQGPPAGSTAPTQAAPAPGAAPQVDLSAMTPREAADRLYDRVMRAASAGDDAEATRFLPMALDAYALVEPLDADGHFHLSLLQRMAGEHEAALATAERVLEDDPDHLLNLSAAAQAALELGDTATATGYFGHLLDVFDAELDRDLPEYREHVALLPTIREEAEELVGAEPGG